MDSHSNHDNESASQFSANLAAVLAHSGAWCSKYHHENLNPALVGTKEPKNYMVPNQTESACQNCLDNLRECDKLQRDVDDPLDPCSECRHFGGTRCLCTLVVDDSYNDVVFDKMLASGLENAYVLPPPEERVNAPMPPHRVKQGWVGQSREQLLAKPDFLPLGVRDCPRAFIVSPYRSCQRTGLEISSSAPSEVEPSRLPKANPAKMAVTPTHTQNRASPPPYIQYANNYYILQSDYDNTSSRQRLLVDRGILEFGPESLIGRRVPYISDEESSASDDKGSIASSPQQVCGASRSDDLDHERLPFPASLFQPLAVNTSDQHSRSRSCEF